MVLNFISKVHKSNCIDDSVVGVFNVEEKKMERCLIVLRRCILDIYRIEDIERGNYESSFSINAGISILKMALAPCHLIGEKYPDALVLVLENYDYLIVTPSSSGRSTKIGSGSLFVDEAETICDEKEKQKCLFLISTFENIESAKETIGITGFFVFYLNGKEINVQNITIKKGATANELLFIEEKMQSFVVNPKESTIQEMFFFHYYSSKKNQAIGFVKHNKPNPEITIFSMDCHPVTSGSSKKKSPPNLLWEIKLPFGRVSKVLAVESNGSILAFGESMVGYYTKLEKNTKAVFDSTIQPSYLLKLEQSNHTEYLVSDLKDGSLLSIKIATPIIEQKDLICKIPLASKKYVTINSLGLYSVSTHMSWITPSKLLLGSRLDDSLILQYSNTKGLKLEAKLYNLSCINSISYLKSGEIVVCSPSKQTQISTLRKFSSLNIFGQMNFAQSAKNVFIIKFDAMLLILVSFEQASSIFSFENYEIKEINDDVFYKWESTVYATTLENDVYLHLSPRSLIIYQVLGYKHTLKNRIDIDSEKASQCKCFNKQYFLIFERNNMMSLFRWNSSKSVIEKIKIMKFASARVFLYDFNEKCLIINTWESRNILKVPLESKEKTETLDLKVLEVQNSICFFDCELSCLMLFNENKILCALTEGFLKILKFDNSTSSQALVIFSVYISPNPIEIYRGLEGIYVLSDTLQYLENKKMLTGSFNFEEKYYTGMHVWAINEIPSEKGVFLIFASGNSLMLATRNMVKEKYSNFLQKKPQEEIDHQVEFVKCFESKIIQAFNPKKEYDKPMIIMQDFLENNCLDDFVFSNGDLIVDMDLIDHKILITASHSANGKKDNEASIFLIKIENKGFEFQQRLDFEEFVLSAKFVSLNKFVVLIGSVLKVYEIVSGEGLLENTNFKINDILTKNINGLPLNCNVFDGKYFVINDEIRGTFVYIYQNNAITLIGREADHLNSECSMYVDDNLITFDKEGFLFVNKLDQNPDYESEKQKFIRFIGNKIGEKITCFTERSVPDPVLEGLLKVNQLKRVILGTKKGSLYLMMSLPNEISRVLMELQSSFLSLIAEKELFLIGYSTARYSKAFVDKPEETSFIDGDVLEAFLELDLNSKENVLLTMNLLEKPDINTIERLIKSLNEGL